VGHGELARDVQGRGEGEDEGGGAAQGGGAGAQVPPPARVGNAKLWTQELEVRGLQVRGRGREVREVEGREEGGPLNRVGTH